jgi:hypothetical protein
MHWVGSGQYRLHRYACRTREQVDCKPYSFLPSTSVRPKLMAANKALIICCKASFPALLSNCVLFCVLQAAARQRRFEGSAVGRAVMKSVREVYQERHAPRPSTGGGANAADWLT